MTRYKSLTAAMISACLLCTTLPAFASADSVQSHITVGFSPSGTAQANVLDAINSATQSINVAAYSFTSKDIAAALVAAKQRGVTVQVVADKKANGGKYSAVTYLANHGVPVRLDDHYAIMHNKFMEIDNKTTESGSFNFTSGANKRNAENALVLWNMPGVASIYLKEFNRLWQESTPLAATW